MIGEILVDVFASERVIGGAPFNFAYHLKKLGLPVRFFSRVGADADGRRILAFVEAKGFDPDDIQIDPQRKTGYVTVAVDAQGVPDFTIHADVAYDFIRPPVLPPSEQFNDVELIYFGSLMQRSELGRRSLAALLGQRAPRTRCFCDINLRSACYTPDTITACLRHAEILKLNNDELDALASLFRYDPPYEEQVRTLIRAFNLQVVILTRGAEAAEVFTPTVHDRLPGIPVPRMEDTVGAGDAFASVCAVGLLHNWPYRRMLTLATRFASGICAVKGALPIADDLYVSLKPYLEKG